MQIQALQTKHTKEQIAQAVSSAAGKADRGVAWVCAVAWHERGGMPLAWNLGNIKCFEKCQAAHDWYEFGGEPYRAYSSLEDGAAGLWSLLAGNYYAPAMKIALTGDYYAAAVKQGELGYYEDNRDRYSKSVRLLALDFEKILGLSTVPASGDALTRNRPTFLGALAMVLIGVVICKRKR
jgi:hypothetical protein